MSLSASPPTPAAPPRPRRRALRRLKLAALFAAFSLVVSVAVVELAARLVFRSYADDARYFQTVYGRVINSPFILERGPQDDPKFGSVLSPNATKTLTAPEFSFTVHTNSQGFRTREVRPKAAGEWRVMMVGDSFFYGEGVEEPDMISAQLERLARSDPAARRPLVVYNLARSGYTTVQELLVARTYAPEVRPDQILVGFFLANDVVPNAASRIDENGNFAPDPAMIERIEADIRARIGWLRHSMIFRIASLSPYTTRLYYQIARQPYILERNYRLLDAFRDYCERRGIALSVVVMHAKDGVRGGLHERWTGSRAVGRKIVEYCRSRDIPVVDVLDFVRGPADLRKYYYPQDGHPNKEGTRRIAEVIFDGAVANHLR